MFLVLLYIMHHSLVIINQTLGRHKLLWIEVYFGVLVFLVNLQTRLSIICQRNFLHLQLPVFCAKAQIRCYYKLKNSFCIIAHLVNNIPTMSHYSWIKKSRRFSEKIHKRKSPIKIKNTIGKMIFYKLIKAKRSENYKKFKFGFKKYIYHLTLEYSQFSIGLDVLNVYLNLI